MSGEVVLQVSTREQLGKKTSRKLAREGKIPAVYYHKGEENLSLEISANVFAKFINSAHGVITLDIDGGKAKKQAIIKSVQYHPVKSLPMHVDFMGISKGQKIKTEVAVLLVGEAPGLKKGGFMEHMIRNVTVECLPKDLPEEIELDVSGLDIGQSLHLKDINIEGIKILGEPDDIVCLMDMPKIAAEPQVEEEEVEELAQPEVIKQKDTDEE